MCGVGDMFVFLVRDCLRENLSYVGRKWSGEGWQEGEDGGLGGGILRGREGGRKGKSEARERKKQARVMVVTLAKEGVGVVDKTCFKNR